MVSFEELKKKSAEMEKSKNLESQKKRKSAANEYEEQSKFVEKIDKRKEQIDKTLKEAEFKKKQSKTAFHGAINELKRQFEYAKDNPNSIFSHFFKKDEDGNVLDKIDFKKAKDEEEGIDEIRDSLKDFKKAAKKESQTKKRVANIENIEKKAKNKKEELYKGTDEYLKKEYLSEGETYSKVIDNVKYDSAGLGFPFKNPEKMIQEESEESIGRLRQIYVDKILDNSTKDSANLIRTPEIRDAVKDYAESYFDNLIELFKLRKETGDRTFSENRGKYILEDFDKKFNEIHNHVFYLENIHKLLASGDLDGGQKISFEKAHHNLPIFQREIEQIEKLEKSKTELELELKTEENLLNELGRKNSWFGKSARRDKMVDLENQINDLKQNLNNLERAIKGKKGEALGGWNGNKYVSKSLDEIVYSDLHKIFKNEKRPNGKVLAEFLRDDFLKREKAKENITLKEYVEAITKYVNQKWDSLKLEEKEVIVPLKESLGRYLELKEKSEESRKKLLSIINSKR